MEDAYSAPFRRVKIARTNSTVCRVSRPRLATLSPLFPLVPRSLPHGSAATRPSRPCAITCALTLGPKRDGLEDGLCFLQKAASSFPTNNPFDGSGQTVFAANTE